MKVYKTRIALKIFGLLFSLPLIIICSGILLIPYIPVPENTIMAEMQNSWPPPGYLFYLIPICLIVINILALILLIGVFRKKVIITEREIIYSNVFTARKLGFYEIESFSIELVHICLKTKKDNVKNININYVGLKGITDLVKTLRTKLRNKS